MQTANPYSPPRAAVAVADIALNGTDSVQPARIFSWRGRIGRLRFLAHTMLVYLIVVALGIALSAIVGMTPTGSSAKVAESLIVLVSIVLMAFVTIQRSHDMDWTGWTMILAFVPFVGLLWVFKPGTAGSNRFGAPPPPNTLGVKIAAFLLPALAVIGILAAVAIPAYQSYVQKVKAAQMK